MREFVFATGNQHKLAEVQAILEGAVLLSGYDGPSPRETGTSFYENAMIKAEAACLATGKPALADDSGIAVEVMGGAPGIFSAIWSGTRSDVANRELLLAQLADISEEHRSASFICTIALVSETERLGFTGIWPGRIAFEATGAGGFGYDPVFIPEGFEVSAAELPAEVKNSHSHRFLALQQLSDYLRG